MRRILLLRPVARFLVSLATALVLVSAPIVWKGWDGYEDYRADRAWLSSDRPELCAQIRSGALSLREALAEIGQNPPRCDPVSIVKERPAGANKLDFGAAAGELIREKECKLLVRKDGEKALALYRVGCVLMPDLAFSKPTEYEDRLRRGSFRQYLWEDLIRPVIADILVGLAAIAMGTFLLLSIGKLYLTETHLGWRRASLVVGTSAFLIAPLSILLVAEEVGAAEVGFAIAAALAAFPLAIVLVLGAKRVAGWVADGFGAESLESIKRQRSDDRMLRSGAAVQMRPSPNANSSGSIDRASTKESAAPPP